MRGMLVGQSEPDYGGTFSAMDAQCGPYSCRRSYNPGLMKSTWAADVGGVDVGHRASIWSAKPDLGQMASGALDSRTEAFIRSIPDSHTAALSIWHEPDVKARRGEFAASDFLAAYKRFAQIVRNIAKPHVWLYVCLSTWSLNGGVSSGLPDEFWPGADLVDVVAWDGYAGSAGESGAAAWGAARDWTAAKNKAWAIGEIGGTSNVTGQARATWMLTQASYAATKGAGGRSCAAWLCWFDDQGNPTPSQYPETIAAARKISAANVLDYTTFVL